MADYYKPLEPKKLWIDTHTLRDHNATYFVTPPQSASDVFSKPTDMIYVSWYDPEFQERMGLPKRKAYKFVKVGRYRGRNPMSRLKSYNEKHNLHMNCQRVYMLPDNTSTDAERKVHKELMERRRGNLVLPPTYGAKELFRVPLQRAFDACEYITQSILAKYSNRSITQADNDDFIAELLARIRKENE